MPSIALDAGYPRSVIVDRTVFNEDYIPEQLIVRREEAEELIFRITDSVLSGAGLSDIIAIVGFQGFVGIGKTTLARYVGREAERILRARGVRFKHVYLNVFNFRIMDIIGSVLRALDEPQLAQVIHGYSPATALRVLADVVYEKNMYVLVILDEIQGILNDRREKLDNLYALLRLHETVPMPSGPPRVGFIIVGTDVDIFSRMRDVVPQLESNIGLRKILYPYTSEQLYKIILQRAEKGLRPGSYDDDVLEIIASAFGYDKGRKGSARKAIKALLRAAELAEMSGRGYITVEDARRATSEQVEPWIGVSELQLMDLHELLVLQAIAELSVTERKLTADLIQSRYAELADELGEKPRRKTQFYEYLARLDNRGIIRKEKGHRRKMIVELAPDLPASRLAEVVRRVIQAKLRGAR